MSGRRPADHGSELAGISRDILRRFCRLPSVAADAPADPRPGDGWVCFTVGLEGAWDGELVLACAPGLARTATARTLRTSPESVTAAEIDDVLGEILSIAVGSLKAALPRPTTYGLPTPWSADGRPGSVRVAGSEVRAAGQALRLTLFRRAPEG